MLPQLPSFSLATSAHYASQRDSGRILVWFVTTIANKSMAFSGQIHSTDIDLCPKLEHWAELDVTEKEIRLVRLCDGFQVETYPLLSAPPYYAVSYFWGPPYPTRQIWIQGQSIEIRETVSDLFEALRDMYGPETHFWIDLLCINQHNLHERNSQVTMMAEIYSGAKGVLSWLGLPTQQSRHAFQIVEEKLHCPANAPDRMWSNRDKSYNFNTAQKTWPSTQQLETDFRLFSNFAEVVAWPAFADLLRRSYWSRMWVVQEIIVAKESILLCGTDAMSLDDFTNVGNEWMRKGQQFERNETNFRLEPVRLSSFQDVVNTWFPIKKISAEYRPQYKTNRILLMELVDSFASKQCYNVLDKVFALRSLSKEAASVTVDYSKTVQEVFLSLVQSGLLLSDGGRGFQSLPSLVWNMGIDHDTLDEQMAKLPSTGIPVRGRWIGTIITTKPPDRELLANLIDQSQPGYLKVSAQGKEMREEHHRSFEAQRVDEFLQRARENDVLVAIPVSSPILLLLRPQKPSGSETVYQAIASLQHWGFKSDPFEDTPSISQIVGEVRVNSASPFDSTHIQEFSIDSHSISVLTLWKATFETYYVWRR